LRTDGQNMQQNENISNDHVCTTYSFDNIPLTRW